MCSIKLREKQEEEKRYKTQEIQCRKEVKRVLRTTMEGDPMM